MLMYQTSPSTSYLNTLVLVNHKKTPNLPPYWKQWSPQNTVSNWSLISGLFTVHLFSLGVRETYCLSPHSPWKPPTLPPSGPDLTRLTLVSTLCTPPCDPFSKPWGFFFFFLDCCIMGNTVSKESEEEVGWVCVCVRAKGGHIPNQWCKTEPLSGEEKKTLINATGCLFERWKGRKGGREGVGRERGRECRKTERRIRAWEGSRRIRESVQCPEEEIWGRNISQLTSVCVCVCARARRVSGVDEGQELMKCS